MSYNPYQIRRCVRHQGENDGRHEFVSKSFTKGDAQYSQSIDTMTGEVTCTCPQFTYRRTLCKHLLRATANLQRRSSDGVNA